MSFRSELWSYSYLLTSIIFCPGGTPRCHAIFCILQVHVKCSWDKLMNKCWEKDMIKRKYNHKEKMVPVLLSILYYYPCGFRPLRNLHNLPSASKTEPQFNYPLSMFIASFISYLSTLTF